MSVWDLKYARSWAGSIPFLWVALALAVLELFNKVHAQYRGERHRDRLLRVLLPIGALAALFATLVIGVYVPEHEQWLATMRLANRAVWTTSWVVILGQYAYFLPSGLKLPHNLLTHRACFLVLLLSESSFRLAGGLSSPLQVAIANMGASVILCACLIVWIFLVRRDGNESAKLEPFTQAEINERLTKYDQAKKDIIDKM
jgi:hypothetical protein